MTKPMNEVKIDNVKGAGSVPYNQEVDYFGLRVVMKPSTFLSLAAPLGDKDNSEMEEYIRSGGAIGAPFLDIAIPKEWDDGDFTAVAKIQGHEGRHRMRAIMAVEGDNPIEVHLFPKYYRARDLTPEFVQHINAGLYAEKSSRIVRGPLFTASAVSEASLGDMRSWFAGRTPTKKPITRSADMRAYFNQEQPVPTTQTKKSTDNFSKLDVPNNIKMTLWKVQNKRQLSRNEYMDLKMWNDRRKLVGEAGPIKLTPPDTKVTDFIEAVYTKYPQQFQNNHVMPMGGDGDDQQFAMFELTPSFSRRGAVEVKWFQAYPLRQGVGSRAMQELQAMAKDAGIALTLFPWDKGQVSQAKLTKFYKSQGFQPTVKGAKNMAWTPESLDEAFDQPYPMSWEKSEADDSMDALARLPDGSNLSIMFNMEYDEEGEEVIQVEFHRNNSQEVTGDGDAQRVFATVLSAIQQYIKAHNPKRLTFSASKEVEPDQNSESRAKLYDRLVIRYARAWGYRPLRADTGTIVRYELSRLKQGVVEDAENFNGIELSMKIEKDDEYVDDEDYDNQVIYVTASSNGRELGHVLFSFDGEYLMPQDLEVEEKYRRQGIAQTMYDYVKSKGYKIRRSGQQTDAGAGFWDKHKPGKNVWEQGVAEARTTLEQNTENIVNEGGWASAATQNTVITPAIIVEVVAGLNEFAKEYNTWQAQSELGLEIKMGKPKGSGTYYERDLKQDPDREYGDIDIECFIHSRPGASSAQLITQYKNAITEFTRHNRDFASDNGTNIIMTTSAGPAQVDLIYTFNEHADWSRALSPEYRVKGVISTSLTSALAEVLNFSFSSQGVQVKTRAGRPVSFRQSKDTELTTVTTNPESWARDMFQYYYTLANGQPYADRLLDLDLHPGLKDEQRLADIVHSIRSLATELERNNLLGQGALDHVANAQTLLTRVSKIYAQKLEAVINSSKFDKAATPAAEEKAKKTKLMLAKYRNEVAKLLLN